MTQKLFDGNELRACIDQYGDVVFARTRKELVQKCNRVHADKMYVDDNNGRTHHVGYVVAGRWFTIYKSA